MGMFDFLKKGKATTTETGLELPPVPHMEGFPEMGESHVPPLPDNSLPPLPTEVPGSVPPEPMEEKLDSPKVDLPPPPDIGLMPEEPKKVEAQNPIPEMPPAPGEVPMYEREATSDIPKAPLAAPEPIAETPVAPTLPEVPPLPAAPDVPSAPEVPAKPEFPAVPDLAKDDLVPDTIPPLEGLPDAPEFNAEPEIPSAHALMEKPIPPVTQVPSTPDMSAMPPMQEETESPYFMPEAPRKDVNGPLFIRTDQFKEIIEHIEHVRSKFKGEDEAFSRVADVKGVQDQKYEDFRLTLEDMQRKLLFIDRSLFEAK